MPATKLKLKLLLGLHPPPCAQLVDGNAAFDASELKSFSEGGHYNADNVATYRKSLAAIDSHVAATKATQVRGGTGGGGGRRSGFFWLRALGLVYMFVSSEHS